MRFGIGWRPELAASIVAHLDEIEVVEVLAEEYVDADAAQKRALRFLASQVPVVVHGTSLGLASSESVDAKRLDAVARVLDWLEPESWSEHLAFVRGGGIEIGHLAAPPRNEATLEGLRRNVQHARRVIGRLPMLENVASLVEPPCCTYDEAEWLRAVVAATECPLLLDLHNLHANATNFGFDAAAVVDDLPQAAIGAIHLAGGRRIERDRILDDHLHEVPDPVFELLGRVDAPEATVILERDGNYPHFDVLRGELARARERSAGNLPAGPSPARRPASCRRTSRLAAGATPATLARIYTDTDPIGVAREAGLEIDRDDLALAARSFARKRVSAARRGGARFRRA